MYYHLRITTKDSYPCTEYFDKQIVVAELQDTNPHYHALVFSDKRPDTVRQFIRSRIPTLGSKGVSYKEVRNPTALHKYIHKEGNVIIDTIPKDELETYLKSKTPKISHKKGETFLNYVISTYNPVYHEDLLSLDDYVDEHLLTCFRDKVELITKLKYRQIRQTLIMTFHNNHIPSSWKQRE